ncbi:hypothetical protein AMTR_s00122p00101180 [Amborella trichopoda]|uniref:Aminotransferase-like plant mobile domain-containing protein n=1 Tax=Amborella trichopoda TaxID=13333 RepID=W1NPR4_AMBTC|nr:hypothetical protein AMTR_s00122p00101180 [Amborella trichopoda]
MWKATYESTNPIQNASDKPSALLADVPLRPTELDDIIYLATYLDFFLCHFVLLWSRAYLIRLKCLYAACNMAEGQRYALAQPNLCIMYHVLRAGTNPQKMLGNMRTLFPIHYVWLDRFLLPRHLHISKREQCQYFPLSSPPDGPSSSISSRITSTGLPSIVIYEFTRRAQLVGSLHKDCVGLLHMPRSGTTSHHPPLQQGFHVIYEFTRRAQLVGSLHQDCVGLLHMPRSEMTSHHHPLQQREKLLETDLCDSKKPAGSFMRDLNELIEVEAIDPTPVPVEKSQGKRATMSPPTTRGKLARDLSNQGKRQERSPPPT